MFRGVIYLMDTNIFIDKKIYSDKKCLEKMEMTEEYMLAIYLQI